MALVDSVLGDNAAKAPIARKSSTGVDEVDIIRIRLRPE